MKVDMSPKAVTERLKLMDELWVLSVKLMNSKKIYHEKLHPEKLSKSFPIDNLVTDWFFRINEESQSNYLAEGIDLYGRKVSHRGSDPNVILDKCVEYAKGKSDS